MKKTILALILAAGLISFAGNAKAAIVFRELDLQYGTSGTLSFSYQPSVSQIVSSTTSILDGGFSVSYSAPSPNYYYPNFGPPTWPASWTLNSLYTSDLSYGQNSSSASYGASVYYSSGGGRQSLISGTIGQTVYVGLTDFKESGMNPAYTGWVAFTTTGTGVQLDAIAFNTQLGAGITIGDTGNGMYTPPPSVPEPSTYVLFGLGSLALIVAYRRKVA